MEHLMTKEELRRNLKTNFNNGLTDEEVKTKEKTYGKNRLEDKKKEGLIIKFIKQFNDFMIIILIISSAISAIMAKIDGSRRLYRINNNDYISCL